MPQKNGMRVRFLFGPAGSGKTFRCLSEIRAELLRAPEGPELILLAPKQATYQLERQLFTDGALGGYTRLQIVSFERLAAFVHARLGRPLPGLLSEEGRVMVLRAILEANLDQLKVFRASARLAGFARQLSGLLSDLQQRRVGPKPLQELAASQDLSPRLAAKLSDLALLYSAYRSWGEGMDFNPLGDVACLLDGAVEALGAQAQGLGLGGLWLDGFAVLTPQEQALLAAVLPHCQHATLAFCLPQPPTHEESWLSPWALVAEAARECSLRVNELPGVAVEVETLERDPARSRFAHSPLLAQVERLFARQGSHDPAVDPALPDESGVPGAAARGADGQRGLSSSPAPSLRLVKCSDVQAEAVLAAREMLSFVRDGGRFRDCAVLVRHLEGYQDVLRRVLTRYGIPFFLDRREAVAHHPLAELTRFALRTVAYDWRQADWLGLLKTGLAGLTDGEVDELENAALARGWEGAEFWLRPIPADADLIGRDRLEERRARVTEPLATLQRQLAQAGWAPSGAALAGHLRDLWTSLNVEDRLEAWARATSGGAVQATVWEQMNDWLDNLERAFGGLAFPLTEWLSIVEAGLSGLSVGVIPPSLDQVLVGSVDRSRNPDLQFVLVLGMNESVFPAPPPAPALLSEAEVAAIESGGVRIGHGRRQFGHERYLGYIALTRARRRVLVSWSLTDAKGNPRNPSRFVDELCRAFPALAVDPFDGSVPWDESCHPIELAGALLREGAPEGLDALRALSSVQPVLQRGQQVLNALGASGLSPGTAAALYGDEPRLSVSALEQFAACPFQFFAARGLRAQEREEFQVDARRTGEFQHEVLAAFHRRLKESGKRWRELAPEQAVEWVREIGVRQLGAYQHGLLAANPAREFQARALIRNLGQVIATLTRWSRQNDFEPEAVELSFGMEEGGWPDWRIELGDGRGVRVRGRVDRVDLCRQPDGSAAMAILDYKSGGRLFEELKFANGLQLQMPAYLAALCGNPRARETFGVDALKPAGVFYVGLRVKPGSGKSRPEAEEAGDEACATAFQHRGRFDERCLERFDTRGAAGGDQFKYRYTQAGQLHKSGNDALPSAAFAQLLEDAAQQIRDLAARILAGEARVWPYAKGQEVACDWCRFRSVCRFDSWTQPYRLLERRNRDGQPAGGKEAAACD
ncbi:MAG: PD-(D/E)XK nuclease family protein [Verrucomicrobia bacterium]|nr:PD-(D/E)XK nuclease family protein [Verrucomicrobiota bacterium]